MNTFLKAEDKTNFNLKEIEATIKLPKIVVEKTLPEKAKEFTAVLKPEDLDNLPAFLEMIKENTLYEKSVKSKNQLYIYGRKGDIFERCFVKTSSFKDNVTILSDAATLARSMLSISLTSVPIYFSPSITSEQISTFLQGVCLTNYKFDRKGEKGSFKKIQKITVYHPDYDVKSPEAQYTINCAKYPLFCREILNSRALEANPTSLLELCKQVAQLNPQVQIETFVGKELLDKGLNLIYSVGRGGQHPPCLVVLKYEGNPETVSEGFLSLVGKGVCFDAGGLNYKKTGAIETQYMDKGGACTVLAAFKGIIEAKLPVNVVVGMAFVENLYGPDAYHPLDILKSYKGLTIEIGNTDAEGRLILADTMSYVQLNYKIHTLLEFSTLTGAVSTALGKNIAGLFSNNKKFAKEIEAAGKIVGENFWKLPLMEEHRTSMKSEHADLNNSSKLPAAGASTAAAFLEYFVEKGVTWAHLDIAAVKATDSEKFVYSVGATGFGVFLILNYLESKYPFDKKALKIEEPRSKEEESSDKSTKDDTATVTESNAGNVETA